MVQQIIGGGLPLICYALRRGESALRATPMPKEFLKWPGSPRVTFRYDQDVEFIRAILDERPCVPSFIDGAKAQAIMDAAIISAKEKRWVDVPK